MVVANVGRGVSRAGLPPRKRDLIVAEWTDNLYWWKPKPRFGFIPRGDNLGDALSPFIVSRVMGQANPQSTPRPSRRRMLAIGSILNHAATGDVIWGSGVNGTKSREDHKFQQLDVRAVRGPKTQAYLAELGIKSPDVFGDPGMLLSRFVKPMQARLDDELYIPHFSQGKALRSDMRTLLTHGSDFQAFVDAIAAARIVYSASLHGLIIAESYGIPAILTMTSTTENLFKYGDYYEGTGRSTFPVAHSMAEARSLEPPPLPDVAAIQDRLLGAFPFDAW